MREEVKTAIMALDRMEKALIYTKEFEELKWEITKETNSKSYGYIPLDVHSFIETLDAVKHDIVKRGFTFKPHRSNTVTFWDFGAGIGGKLLMARAMGFQAKGVEFSRKYIEQANRVLEDRSSMIEGDLTKMHADWIPFRSRNPIIAYYYCPMRDRASQIQFERNLENLLPKGSYLLPFMKQDVTISKDERFKNYISKGRSANFFRKIKNNETIQSNQGHTN